MEILKYFWQLPQLIVAFIYYWYLKRKDEILDTCTCQGAIVFIKRKSCGSVTLGNHIFLSPRATDTTVRHEWGAYKTKFNTRTIIPYSYRYS